MLACNTKTTLIEDIIITSEKCLIKSIPFFCLKPFTTKLALYIGHELVSSCLTWKTTYSSKPSSPLEYQPTHMFGYHKKTSSLLAKPSSTYPSPCGSQLHCNFLALNFHWLIVIYSDDGHLYMELGPYLTSLVEVPPLN